MNVSFEPRAIFPLTDARVTFSGAVSTLGRMRIEDMIFISVDDHLVEPPHVFEGRMPARFADRAPRVEHTDSGDDVWIFNGQTIPNIGLNAVAGRPK